MKLRWGAAWLAGVGLAAAAALALRFIGLGYGLPHTFNADEPHLVNMAVSFGGGSLAPYSFKYPTLWPYLLAFFYGLYFLVWSGLGLLGSVTDFIGLYAWDPTGFYLIGRCLSALATLAACLVVGRLELAARKSPAALPWGALGLGLAPILVELAHSAKPDGLMFLLASCGWWFALRLMTEGGTRYSLLCGASLGLAVSTQYTAAPVAVLIPLAVVLSPRRSWRDLGLGLSGCAAAFLLASPYVLIDFPNFRASLADMSYMRLYQTEAQHEIARRVVLNLWGFLGEGTLGGALAVLGLVTLLRRRWRLALFCAVPVAASASVLAASPDGGWLRYLLACMPGLALLAGEGMEVLWAGRRARLKAALAAFVLVPSFYLSMVYVEQLLLPDTRTLSGTWIASQLPSGSTLLLDQAHAGPRVLMSQAQVSELAQSSQAAGSPRAKLYGAMAKTHPGGGYRVLRIQRSSKDLWTAPGLVARSQEDAPTLDVRGGLDPARAMRVDYVVTSGYGASPKRAPELTAFFDELQSQGRIVQEFLPMPGEVAGAAIRVYSLSRPR